MPEAHTFFPDSHREWNIDNMSVGQIRQMIDIMYTEYKLMCLRGKSEVDACKTIIQCFTGTLLRWWEAESSPKLIETMEAEVLKDEKGDVIHNQDGTVTNNMIGALTSMILEHWCGCEVEIADKHEVILMNLKCHKMSQYDDFHRDWMQRIYEVKDSKNLLWKQVYLAALPSRFVDYLKMQDIFQLPYESHTWGEIYSLITKTLVSLCTSSRVNKSLEKLSKLPDRKSICSKY